jgi:hypothetical protein
MLIRNVAIPVLTAYFGSASGFTSSFVRTTGSITCIHRHLHLSLSSWARQRQPKLRMLSASTANLGQDLGEMFDTYKEPDATFFTAKGGSNPVKSGQSLPRKQVHANGVWHRAVHIWVYNSKGQVILQKRYFVSENCWSWMSSSCIRMNNARVGK